MLPLSPLCCTHSFHSLGARACNPQEGLKKVRKDLERQRGMEALPHIGPKLKVKDFYWEPKLEVRMSYVGS